MGTATLTEEDLRAVTLQSMPGGKYTGIANGDGTWNVLNFPIFTVVLKGEKGAPEDVREKWMDAAFAKGKAREKGDEFWGPAHVNHHGEPKPTAHAGFLRFRSRGEVTYEGETLPAIFADAVRVPEPVFREMEAGRLPYVSVEIASWIDPEIASVAFMADETSFFRLPLFTIGDKLVATDAVRIPPGAHSPQIAYRPTLRASNKSFILFNLGTKVQGDQTVNLKEEKKKAKASLEAAFAALVKLDGGGAGGDPGAAPADGGEGDAGDGAFYQAMLEFALRKMKVIGGKQLEAGGEVEETNEQGTDAGKRAKPVEIKPKAKANADTEDEAMTKEEIASLVAEEVKKASLTVESKFSAELEKSNAKISVRDEKDRVSELVKKSKDELRGWYLSPQMNERIERFAASDKDGKMLAELVAHHKATVPRDNPIGATGGPRGGAPRTDPKADAKTVEVMAKFSATPDEQAKAAKFQREYELAKSTGHTSLSLDRFMEISMRLPSRQTPEEQANVQTQETNVR